MAYGQRDDVFASISEERIAALNECVISIAQEPRRPPNTACCRPSSIGLPFDPAGDHAGGQSKVCNDAIVPV